MAIHLTDAEYALVKEELESRKAYISKERAAMIADGRIDSQEFVYELEDVMGQIKDAAEASKNQITPVLSPEAAKFLQMSGYTVTGAGTEYTVAW